MSVSRFVRPIGIMRSISTAWPTTSWTTRCPASSSSIWATARSTATAFVNGVGLPDNLKSNYKNNLKDFLISHVNLPFHYVGGNIDLTDYSHNPGLPGHDNDPFVLMKTYINETELNNYPYAFMRNGILFLAVPEMDAEPWTRPATCEWLEFMTTHYHDATTIILSHQAIEDTTPADGAADSYRGQQDQGWWASLFQRNPQIKMFLHGHNHMAGWYQGSQSSGFSRPVQNFGHEMVFASPFPGMSWIVDYNLVDSIVIFTISPRFITAKAWKQDGTRGKWCAGFDHTWVVPTTFDPNAEDWYSFPFLIQDGETQQTDMKVLSANTTLQLVGTGPVELFYDPNMETKGIHTNENILGFDDDLTSKVTANTPGMTVHGPHTITFPPKHEWDRYCHDGHGGPPYRMFAVGTTPAAAPGGSYTVTMKAKSRSGNGRFKLTMSCSDWGTKSQYSTLAGSSREVISHTFGTNDETVTGTYTAPNDDNGVVHPGEPGIRGRDGLRRVVFQHQANADQRRHGRFPDRAERKIVRGRRKARAFQDEGVPDQSRGPGRS